MNTAVIVEKPKLRSQIVKFENRNIVAKLWALIFMSGNTLVEYLIYDMLNTGEMPPVTLLVQKAMVDPAPTILSDSDGTSSNTTLFFRKIYSEVRQNKDIQHYFLGGPVTDTWDGLTVGTIRNNPFSSFIYKELFEMVRMPVLL